MKGMELTGLYRHTGRISGFSGEGVRATVMFRTVRMVRLSSRISLYWQCAPREGIYPQNGLLGQGRRVKVRGLLVPRIRTCGNRLYWSDVGQHLTDLIHTPEIGVSF
jgi:hypothetical protein